MNEEIINRWNNVVSEDDTIFHLGDVALGPWQMWDSILTRLNGYKVLVVGNHDRIFKGEKERMRERFTPLYNEWFDEVHDGVRGFALDDGKILVNMSHFPYDGDSHDDDRFTGFRLEDRGTVLIHGHTHLNQIVSHSGSNTLQIHVGQDAWDYTPVSEDQIVSLLRSQML